MKSAASRWLVGAAVMAAVSISGRPAEAQASACGTPTSTTLVAGQHYVAGTISVSNDANYLYVTYTSDSPWLLSEAHAAVAGTLEEIPQSRAGNPIPGRFAYSATFDPEVSTYTFGIPIAGVFTAGQTLYVAAHSVVQAPRDQGGSQTAWGEGPSFRGNNWAMYLNYTVQSCDGGGGNS